MICRAELLKAAAAARSHAYAPYSGFTVGAALLDSDGTIHTGCNVENAAYGDTCCAERVALFKAVSNGIRGFTAVAVVGGKRDEDASAPCFPCGTCRQVMAEFCDNELVVLTTDGETTLGALLPQAFRLK